MIVGDLHGCFEELEALLEVVAFSPSDDRLVSVGDLVGKGPYGAETVRFFREGGHEAVLGNHEARLLAWHRGTSARPLKKVHQRHADALSREDWAWLEGLPLWLELPDYAMCVIHGGRFPDLPLEAHEPHVLYTMRSIRPDGTSSNRVDDGVPWASRWDGPEEIVFGHDAIRGLQKWPHATGLDTGCVYGNSLSAYVLPDRRIVSVPAKAVYEEPGP